MTITETSLLQQFENVIAYDYEFSQPNGCRPEPSLLCGVEVFGEREWVYRRDQLVAMDTFPFPENALFIGHYLVAENSCNIALGWDMPKYQICGWTEEKNRRFGIPNKYGFSLVDCLGAYGLPTRNSLYKQEMQNVGMAGGPDDGDEAGWKAFEKYCLEDCRDSAELFKKQMPFLENLGQSMLRARYLRAVAQMEHNGIPLDMPTLEHLEQQWPTIKTGIIADVNPRYGVYDENGSFKTHLFEEWLVNNDIPWPRLASGELDLGDDTFKTMARAYPIVSELREARKAISRMTLFQDLRRGPDGRNRCSLKPFASKTSRNQPSNTQMIFGGFRSIRSLIKPEPGMSIAYCDYTSQEFQIAAALSQDENMLQAYQSGDVYLAFAKLCGAVPEDATKESHPTERALYKSTVLALSYGMGEYSLAARIGGTRLEAHHLIQQHKETFPTFWKWAQGYVDQGMLFNRVQTVFGWTAHTPDADEFGVRRANDRSLMNFGCQANAAEILRLACSMLCEANIKVCAPIHDAVLIEAPTEEIESTVRKTKTIMEQASSVVLNGHICRVDADIFSYPNSFVDEAGQEFWTTLCRLGGLPTE